MNPVLGIETWGFELALSGTSISFCQSNKEGQLASTSSATLFEPYCVTGTVVSTGDTVGSKQKDTEMQSKERKGVDLPIRCLVVLGKIVKFMGNLCWDTVVWAPWYEDQ